MKPDKEKFRVIQPLASILAVIITTAALIFAIYFTERDQLWVPFLSGILVASTLAAATRMLHTERIAIRRAEELMNVKIKLDREMQLRKSAEESIATSKSKLILLDEALPIMVALIDINGLCQYYNKRFMNWLLYQPQQIEGRHIREILGIKIYREVATAIRHSLKGHPVLYKRKQKMEDGTIHRLLVEHLPQFDDNGKVSGFYMLINDITTPDNVDILDQLEEKESTNRFNVPDKGDFSHDVKVNADVLVVDPFNEQTVANDKWIMNAIENGEYCLFRQLITPITANSAKVEYYEILIRLKGADQILLMPAEFLPVAQMNRQMLYLDQWVVKRIIEWISCQNPPGEKRKNPMFFINLSEDSIEDSSFTEFLETTLQDHNVPGAALCFEIPAVELVLRNSEIAELVDKVKKFGCHIAISGFGQDRVLFDLMRGIEIDFIKIDGSIIRNIIHETTDRTTVSAINKEAKKFHIQTIAESVENEESIVKLQEIGINFVQGHGISRPHPLAKLSKRF
jgi:PAS domain S-box-containing protein